VCASGKDREWSIVGDGVGKDIGRRPQSFILESLSILWDRLAVCCHLFEVISKSSLVHLKDLSRKGHGRSVIHCCEVYLIKIKCDLPELMITRSFLKSPM
jgi:hypothetical protein